MSKPGTEYRADIDGLRAVAVSVVVLFHLNVSWLPGGFVGVDVFFVISGFLITSLILRQIEAGTFSLIDFYERRFRRIYPNLLIVLYATIALGWLALMPETYRFLGRTLVWSALSASNFVFMGGTGYFDPRGIDKPLLHTWSLGVEEQFYLVFPWLLILAARHGCRTSWLVVGGVALSLALSIAAGEAGWPAAYFMLPTRFWELGTGALVAILPLSSRLTPTRQAALSLTGVSAIAWACLFLKESTSFPGYEALVPVIGAAVVIASGGGPVNRLIGLRPFAWVGRLSYAIYLWHWPLISIGASIGFLPEDISTRVAVIGLSLAFSFIGYHIWEMPIRRRRLLTSRRALFVTLALSVALCVTMGIAIFSARGVPQRLPAGLLQVYENARENSRIILKKCPRDDTKPYSCPIGSTSTDRVSFMIFGDSHSEAVAAEIGDIAEQYGLHGIFVGKASCRLLIEPVTKVNQICVMQNEYSIAQYKELKPELVIIINYWQGITKENGYYTRDGKIVGGAVFDRTMDIFKNSKTLVSVTVPVYKDIVSKVAWSNIIRARIGLPEIIEPNISTDEYHQQKNLSLGILNAEKEKNPNLNILDPEKAFCSEQSCISMYNSLPLYYDTDHLSHLGALRYAPLLKPYFSDLAQQISSIQSGKETTQVK